MNQKERENINNYFKENCGLFEAVGWNRIIRMDLLDRYHYINELNESTDSEKDKLFYCIKAHQLGLPKERWLRAYRPIPGYSERVEEVRFNPYEDDEIWDKIGKGFTFVKQKSDSDSDYVLRGNVTESESESDSETVEIGNITDNPPVAPPRPKGKTFRKSIKSKSSAQTARRKSKSPPKRTTKKKASSKKIVKRKSKRKSSKATTKKKSKRKSVSKRKSNKKRKSKRKSVSKRFKRSH